MRYMRLVLDPGEEGFHPADRVLTAEPSLERESIHQINLLDDGTVVLLYQLRGALDRVPDLLADRADVLVCDVSGEREGLAYLHIEPNELLRSLLEIRQEHEFVLQMPLRYDADGGLHISVVGEDEALTRAVAAIPETVAVTLEETGEYHPDIDQLFSTLTPRQQEVLRAAVEAGYYAVPRRATHEDVASMVDCTAGTVGEHLRKIEARVLAEVVP